MNSITKIVIYLIIGAIGLDILTHASGFSTATSSVFKGFNKSLSTISGG